MKFVIAIGQPGVRVLIPALFALISIVGSHASASAQTSTAYPQVDSLEHRADSLHNAGEVLEALRTLEQALAVDEDCFSCLWKAAREAVLMGINAADTRSQNEWYELGEDFGLRATRLAPADTTATYWLIANQGRRAVQTDAFTAARLGTSVYERAREILQIDSLHAGANHALGVLNVEVMKLNRVKRLIARSIVGTRAFRDTSWEQAETFLTRAVEKEPDQALYHLDLAKAYFLQNKMEQARHQFTLVVDNDIEGPTSDVLRAQARRYLQRIP